MSRLIPNFGRGRSEENGLGMPKGGPKRRFRPSDAGPPFAGTAPAGPKLPHCSRPPVLLPLPASVRGAHAPPPSRGRRATPAGSLSRCAGGSSQTFGRSAAARRTSPQNGNARRGELGRIDGKPPESTTPISVRTAHALRTYDGRVTGFRAWISRADGRFARSTVGEHGISRRMRPAGLRSPCGVAPRVRVDRDSRRIVKKRF